MGAVPYILADGCDMLVVVSKLKKGERCVPSHQNDSVSGLRSDIVCHVI